MTTPVHLTIEIQNVRQLSLVQRPIAIEPVVVKGKSPAKQLSPEQSGPPQFIIEIDAIDWDSPAIRSSPYPIVSQNVITNFQCSFRVVETEVHPYNWPY